MASIALGSPRAQHAQAPHDLALDRDGHHHAAEVHGDLPFLPILRRGVLLLLLLLLPSQPLHIDFWHEPSGSVLLVSSDDIDEAHDPPLDGESLQRLEGLILRPDVQEVAFVDDQHPLRLLGRHREHAHAVPDLRNHGLELRYLLLEDLGTENAIFSDRETNKELEQALFLVFRDRSRSDEGDFE